MLEYFWMEVKEINTGQLKQKWEIYDKDISGFWNQKKKNTLRSYFFISNF